jgi:V8-like Glu-specific endopeptidase
MNQFSWNNGKGGNWNDLASWDLAVVGVHPEAVPTATDSVVIEQPSAVKGSSYTVTSAQAAAMSSLVVGKPVNLAITGGEFKVQVAAFNYGTVTVKSATLSAGQFRNYGSAVLNLDNATLQGTILTDPANQFSINISGTLKIKSAASFVGNAIVKLAKNNIVSDGRAATFTNAVTLSGSGTIGDAWLTFSNAKDGVIEARNGITIDTGSHKISNAGKMSALAGNLDIKSAIDNAGLIQAGSEGRNSGRINIYSGVANSGAIVARDNGWLVFYKSTVVNSGAGRVTFDSKGMGSVSSSGVGLIGAEGQGARVSLDSATIRGGLVETVKGSTLYADGRDQIDAPVLNNGNIMMQPESELDLRRSVVGEGTITIDRGGTLELDSVCDKRMTINFEPWQLGAGLTNDAIMKLDARQGFAGTVSGFSRDDIIDIMNMPFGRGTSVSYSGGKLHLSDGTSHVDLSLSGGNYTSGNFFVASDGAKGTQVTYQNDCVCLITAMDSKGQKWNGSGVIIGPHTVLTAAHVVGGLDPIPYHDIKVYAGLSKSDGLVRNGVQAVTGPYDIHYNSLSGSGAQGAARDFAVIDFASTFTKYLQLSEDAGVYATAVGYADKDQGQQKALDCEIRKGPDADPYSAFDISQQLIFSQGLSHGDSGGPLLVDGKVVGVISATAGVDRAWAPRINHFDKMTIEHQWEAADSTVNANLLQTNGSVTDKGGSAAGIKGKSTIEITDASAQSVTFDSNAQDGALQLDHSKQYDGTIYNFRAGEFIDFRDVPCIPGKTQAFFPTAFNDQPLNTSFFKGDLIVTNDDKKIEAKLHLDQLVGAMTNYMASTFVTQGDGYGGTLVSIKDPNAQGTPILAPSH